jgi:hypothetical protein
LAAAGSTLDVVGKTLSSAMSMVLVAKCVASIILFLPVMERSIKVSGIGAPTSISFALKTLAPKHSMVLMVLL